MGTRRSCTIDTVINNLLIARYPNNNVAVKNNRQKTRTRFVIVLRAYASRSSRKIVHLRFTYLIHENNNNGNVIRSCQRTKRFHTGQTDAKRDIRARVMFVLFFFVFFLFSPNRLRLRVKKL